MLSKIYFVNHGKPRTIDRRDIDKEVHMKNFRMGIAIAVVCSTLGVGSVYAQGLDDGWVFGGNTLSAGGNAEFTREFTAYKTYIIMADGQAGADDVDIEILDSRRNVVVSDFSSSRQARVVFRPVFSGSYTIRLTLARGSGKPLCYYFVFVESGGWEMSAETFSSVLARVDIAVLAASNATGAVPERFFGYILHPNQKQSIVVRGLNGGYVAFAVGSDRVRDVDLTVRRNGRIIERDINPDDIAFCIFDNQFGEVELEVHYVLGSGPAVVVVGLCQKPAPSLRRL